MRFLFHKMVRRNHCQKSTEAVTGELFGSLWGGTDWMLPEAPQIKL